MVPSVAECAPVRPTTGLGAIGKTRGFCCGRRPCTSLRRSSTTPELLCYRCPVCSADADQPIAPQTNSSLKMSFSRRHSQFETAFRSTPPKKLDRGIMPCVRSRVTGDGRYFFLVIGKQATPSSGAAMRQNRLPCRAGKSREQETESSMPGIPVAESVRRIDWFRCFGISIIESFRSAQRVPSKTDARNRHRAARTLARARLQIHARFAQRQTRQTP